MVSAMLRTLSLLVLLLAATTGTARTPPELPPHAVVVSAAAALPQGEARVEALRHAVDAEGEKADAGLAPAEFEVLADALIPLLAQEPASEARRRWLAGLKHWQPVHWQQHPETRTPWYLPVFDLAAASAHLLARWEREAMAEDLLPAVLVQGRWTPALLAAAEPVQVEVLARLPADARAALIEPGLPPGLGPALWRVALGESDEAGLWDSAIALAPDEALRAQAEAVWRLPPQRARGWLQRLSEERPALADMAVLARRADPDPAARRDALFASLGHAATRDAAAAALAGDRELEDAELIARFEATVDPVVRRGLALALRLRDSAATRSFLDDWSQSAARGDPLREALR
jgi:hypothetical protein